MRRSRGVGLQARAKFLRGRGAASGDRRAEAKTRRVGASRGVYSGDSFSVLLLREFTPTLYDPAELWVSLVELTSKPRFVISNRQRDVQHVLRQSWRNNHLASCKILANKKMAYRESITYNHYTGASLIRRIDAPRYSP